MRSTFFTILALLFISNAFADTEPNNTQQTALTLSQDRTVAGTQSDDDWYVINVVAGKRILIDLNFTHTDGNIDMDLVKKDGFLRAVSDSFSDHEFIDNDISLSVTGAYYIRVYGDDQGNSYTLTWTELSGSDDNFEDNNNGLEAKPIIKDVVALGSQSDQDWYSISVNSGITRVLASLRFTKLGKLDMVLFDTDGNSLASSTNSAAGVNEFINFDVLTAGTYHLRISGNNSSDGYALNWAAVSSTLDSDADGVGDYIDNCTFRANPTQCDGDNDGYGNHCDADFNNDLIVNGLDIGPFKTGFGTADPVTDLNCDGVTNGLDDGPLKTMFGSPPGPSALAP